MMALFSLLGPLLQYIFPRLRGVQHLELFWIPLIIYRVSNFPILKERGYIQFTHDVTTDISGEDQKTCFLEESS